MSREALARARRSGLFSVASLVTLACLAVGAVLYFVILVETPWLAAFEILQARIAGRL